MNRMKKLLLVFGILLCAYEISVSALSISKLKDSVDTLQKAFIVFRHGDRTPLITYPTDPYINYSWPGGYGALTVNGSLMAYNLGKHLRYKYAMLLPSDGLYSKQYLKVFSSDTERTIMSAESVLTGLLPPPESKNLLPIKWQPVPVHVIPKSEDKILLGSRTCQKFEKELQKLLKNPPKDYIKMIENIFPKHNLYDYLSEHTGINVTNPWPLYDIYDTLYIEGLYGFKLPKWSEPISVQKMRPVLERVNAICTANFEMKRLRAGPFLTEIVKIITSKTAKKHQKLFLYSAHDSTLLGLIRTLGIENQTTKIPDYSSALVFEIHKGGNSLEVKLYFYENSEAEKPIQVKIPNCQEPCSMDNFIKIVSPYFVSNYDKACNDEE